MSTLAEVDLDAARQTRTPSDREVVEEIESRWFPGGARQMAEVINRDPTLVHLAERQFGDAAPAVRFVLAAAAGGDLTGDEAQKLLAELARESGSEAALERVSTELGAWLERARGVLSQVAPEKANRLRDFLRGHRILVVEDKWEREYWHLLLPTILGGRLVKKFGEVRPGEEAQILVAPNGSAAVEVIERSGREPDIVLLDLYSSNEPEPHHAVSQITISTGIRQLISRLRKGREQGGGVPAADAAIISMSADLGGFSVRTMLREFGADDYVFKRVGWDAQKPSFYATFRNAVVSGLVKRVVRALALPDEASAGHAAVPFGVWLRQFLPAHRPRALAMMRGFRYYSASSVVGVYDRALSAAGSTEEGGIKVLESARRDPGDVVFSYLGRPNKSGVAALHLVAKTDFFRAVRSTLKGGGMPKIVSYGDMVRILRDKLSGASDDRSPITVVLIDDVIGSGGQTASYLGRYLVERVKRLGRPAESRAAHTLVIESAEGTGASVDVRLLFAVGWPNAEIDARLKMAVDLGQGLRRGLIEAEGRDGKPIQGWGFPVYVADWLTQGGRLQDPEGEAGFLKEKPYLGLADCREDEGERSEDFEPFGWKDSGGLLATYANVPGNVPPVVWGSRGGWKPLFPRFFNQFTPKRQGSEEPGADLAAPTDHDLRNEVISDGGT